MSGMNRAMLIGRLGRDPELKQIDGGRAMARMRLATNESYTDKEGQRQERTEWHDVVVWGRMAETAGKYLHKGRQVYVEGRLQTRTWTTKEGQERTTTQVVADNIQFLGDGRGAPADPGGIPEAPEAPF